MVMKMVMEHEKLVKSNGICDQSWNFTNFAPELHQICILLVTAKKLISNLGSPHFPTFLRKMSQNWEKRWSWQIKKWSWKLHGKIFCQVYGNPAGGLKGAIHVSEIFRILAVLSISLQGSKICVSSCPRRPKNE